MHVIGTAALLLGAAGLASIAIKGARGLAAPAVPTRYRYKRYAEVCADAARERRRLARIANGGGRA